MTELKSGESLDFQVGDKTLTIEPVPYGNIKKILRIAFQASKEISSGNLTTLPELIDRNLAELFPLLFSAGRYPFLDGEWIETHMTVPVLRKMLEAAVVVNGLEDFFGKAIKKTEPNGSPPTRETPPGNPGSITSSGSLTDGGPKTLTN